jgi:hypothetical protein
MNNRWPSSRVIAMQRAFVVAHRASENPEHSPTSRAVFRKIAKLIWQAHGEQKAFPSRRQLDEATAQGAGTPGQHETAEGPRNAGQHETKEGPNQ